jgi:radical SAM protein with 4Fe4S-binding SPASM domain
MLETFGVEYWQLQFGLPMGNLTKDEIIDPKQSSEIIDFAHGLIDSSPLKLYPADCVGYYTKKSMALRKGVAGQTAFWQGCTAGKYSIGILHDGSVLGCTSIRDKQFIEGSIRKTSLRRIWEDENAFSWNRNFSRDHLRGFCGRCRFGDLCLGGCQNVKLATTGDFGENRYCAYRNSIEGLRPKIEKMSDIGRLLERAEKAVELELLETAEMCLDRALGIAPNSMDILRLLGFVSYSLKDYEKSLRTNQKALDLVPHDTYSLKGLGVCLVRLGRTEEGIKCLKQAVRQTDAGYMDP